MRCSKNVSDELTNRCCVLDAGHSIPCVMQPDWMPSDSVKASTTARDWDSLLGTIEAVSLLLRNGDTAPALSEIEKASRLAEALQLALSAQASTIALCPECGHAWHDAACSFVLGPGESSAASDALCCGCLAHEGRPVSATTAPTLEPQKADMQELREFRAANIDAWFLFESKNSWMARALKAEAALTLASRIDRTLSDCNICGSGMVQCTGCGAELANRVEAIQHEPDCAWLALDAAALLSVSALDPIQQKQLQRGLSRLNPMQRSSAETISCVFCGADKTYSYVIGDRTPHAEDCQWRMACEAQGVPWNHVL